MQPQQLSKVDAGTPAADTTRDDGARSWRQLALLSGLISMDNSEGAVVSTLFPAIRTALDLKLAALGNLVAASKIAGMIFGPIWVAAAARFGRKNILVVCCGLWGVWSIAAGFAQNFAQLFAVYVIAAIGFAAGGPLINGILADLFDESRRGRAAGWLYAGFAVLGAVISPLLGQLSKVPDGWRYGFFASGAITVVFGLLVWRYFVDPRIGAADAAPTTPGTRARGWTQMRDALRIRTRRLMMVQRLTATQLAFLSFGVVFMVNVRDFSNAQAAVVAPAAMLFYVAGTVLGGFVGDHAGRLLPGGGRLAVWQLAVLAWAGAAALCTQIAWPSIWIYAVAFAALGLLQGFGPGSNRPILMEVTRPELRSAAFSLMLGAESAGWALSTLALGYVGDAVGLQAAFLWLIVVANLANGLFMFFMYRPYQRESSELRSELAAARAIDIGTRP
ncbi:MFS transporter [Nocardia sp. CWNU-33]|uniref:MFS transporter n=1 Tax=Nocardia sp. CWNU-33 TaxID=3392117 RepID=UPI00398E414E